MVSRGAPIQIRYSAAEESLEELKALAESAGARVEETMIQSRPAPDAATLIGSGKLEELRRLVDFHAADVVLFDSELTPTQQRNLERALALQDSRSDAIDPRHFRSPRPHARRAVAGGTGAVELPAAAPDRTRRRRCRGWAAASGRAVLVKRNWKRTAAESIAASRNSTIDLENVRSGRGTQRRQRQSVPLATIALVGYTNAGKSTLFNRLTGAEVMADARMFATLDPTVRHVTLPSHRKVLVSDTVGFIRNLPTTLVKAFRATLEEVTEASLLLHVVDASSPYAPHQTAHVLEGAVRDRRRSDAADSGAQQNGSAWTAGAAIRRVWRSAFWAK